jgi:hypothetical protein
VGTRGVVELEMLPHPGERVRGHDRVIAVALADEGGAPPRCSGRPRAGDDLRSPSEALSTSAGRVILSVAVRRTRRPAGPESALTNTDVRSYCSCVNSKSTAISVSEVTGRLAVKLTVALS